MRKTNLMSSIVGSLLSLSSVAAMASNSCLDRVQDKGWHQDKHLLVLSCNKTQSIVGSTVFDRLCFAITKKQYNDYKDTWYTTITFQSNSPGGLRTIVAVNEAGEVGEDGAISKNGSVLKISSEKYSIEFDQKWIETTVIDLKDLSKVRYDVHDKKFFKNELKQSTVYSCEKIQ